MDQTTGGVTRYARQGAAPWKTGRVCLLCALVATFGVGVATGLAAYDADPVRVVTLALWCLLLPPVTFALPWPARLVLIVVGCVGVLAWASDGTPTSGAYVLGAIGGLGPGADGSRASSLAWWSDTAWDSALRPRSLRDTD